MKKKNAKKQEIDFLSLAAHELRTPLSIVKGYVSLILEGQFGTVTPKLKPALKAVYLANERVVRLVDNLLGVAQLEDKRFLSISRQSCDINSLIKAAVKEMRPKAKAKGLLLRSSLAVQKTVIKADELMLHQVLINLLNNAIKYSDRGTISVVLEKAGHKIRISVQDQGAGLEARELRALFKKFERRSGKKNVPGFGLGLYASQLIVRAHKGRIWAESRGKDFGFKVSFEIPKA